MRMFRLKRLLAILLTVVVLFSACIPVMAYSDFSSADLNRDGSENILDLIFLKKYIANLTYDNTTDYDVIDSKVQYSAGDLIMLIKYLLGVSNSFEPGSDNDLSDIF